MGLKPHEVRIAQLTLKSFRCFGAEPVTVDLDDLTALIGANGSGKSAVLVALTRLFGASSTDRHLQPGDFHIPHDADPSTIDQIDIMIEARLEFPELIFATEESAAIPPCFNHMVLGEGDDLFCRVRLEGSWTRSSLPEGDIEEKAYWITTESDEVKDEHKRPMQAYERSMIHVLYVPAFRDTSKQLTQASGSLVYRLLRAIEWSETVKEAVKDSTQTIRDSVRDEESIRHLHECLGKAWRTLHDMPAFKNVAFQPLGSGLDDLLRHVEVVFSPGADGREHSIDRLSDGLKSLFYFSLVAAVFQIEEAVKQKQLATTNPEAGEAESPEDAPDLAPDPLAAFSADRLRPPALTLFAIEEPENHLAPQYLGRIMELLRTIADSSSGQVVFTSHSPAIMSRIDPQRVRYLRLEADSLLTQVKNIILPAETEEAFKYVKEAVRAYPELYFARLVILGEGDSEETLLPRAAKASGIEVDTSFISVVPLGGRHVNHFWKLLHALEIPHLTLLDLDRERLGGGWRRIHYACDQLIKVGVPRKEILTIDDEKGGTKIMGADEFAKMVDYDYSDEKVLTGWLEMLEKYGVFFSAPLDLDFLMLRAFPAQYQAAGDGSPRIPKDPTKLAERVQQAIAVVLKDEGGDGATYSDEEKGAFIWYSYLFLGKSKPATHLLALNLIKSSDLTKKMPPMLSRLNKAIQSKIPAKNEPIA
jgi:energy-coupling factor transporter ATP-binding protein EcfA2